MYGVFRKCPCVCHVKRHCTRLSTSFMHTNPWTDTGGVGSVEIPLRNRHLQISTGRLARFTDGCAVAQLGDTSVMVTAVSRQRSSPASFLPLTVDYRQKAAAAGRIPTNFLRRELGATDKEILTGRMIDRSIRPLFPANFSCDTQLVCNLLAVDSHNDPDVVSINAASAALALSDIPWDGPVGAVRVGFVDNEPVINPSRHQMRNSLLNLVVTGSDKKKVLMLDGSAEVLPQDLFLHALKEALKETQIIVNNIKTLQKSHGKPKRPVENPYSLPDDILQTIDSLCQNRIREVYTDFSHHKISRDTAVQAIREDVVAILQESYPDISSHELSRAVYDVNRKVFRSLVLDTDARCDGRSLTEIRPISSQVDLYRPLHGSALFQRGQTQVLCAVTFDSPESAAKLDTLSALTSGLKEKNFFLHYEFPPYATNDTGRSGGGGRRELGHGALAEKALRSVVPSNYPFTIRLTSEVLESNGSSSMATVCGGSLALMDAGVPLSAPAAGVAVGLISESDSETGEIDRYKLLTDLLGIEDYNGDMDFKVAGTKHGITAVQADVKLSGLPMGIVTESVQAACDGIRRILDTMKSTIAGPREDKKESWPVTDKLTVPIEKRAKFVGVAGYNLKKLTLETGVSITPLDETTYQLFAPSQSAFEEASEKIDEILSEERQPEIEFGAICQAVITEIRDYGVMVQLYPGMTPTLIHNSQLDQRKISHPSALNLHVGQEISAKYFGRDPANGKMRLSRKVLYSTATSTIKKLGNNSNR